MLTESAIHFVIEEKAIFQNSQMALKRTKIWPSIATELETKDYGAGEGHQQVSAFLRLPGLR
jgi:hypothetical protein